MKAAFIREHGGPSVLQYGELPEPTPGPGEVLVRVRAASLNRLDLYTRAGTRGSKVPEGEMPRILGGDGAGEVAALGDGEAGKTGSRSLVGDAALDGIYRKAGAVVEHGHDAASLSRPRREASPALPL